jgi:2-dehydropantoate 2-reductase
MHTDFSSGKRAELESLVGYVVEQAKKLNVPIPAYEKVYGELAKKQKRAAGG